MRLTTIKGKPSEVSGEGYKVFEPDASSHLCFIWYAPKGEGSRVKYDHWYKDEGDEGIDINYKTSYPTGFHVYLDYPINFFPRHIRKVSYKGGHTKGVQGYNRFIVAREILIHRKVKK